MCIRDRAAGRTLDTERGGLRIPRAELEVLPPSERIDAARRVLEEAGIGEQAPVLTGEAGLFDLRVDDLREVMVYRPVARRGAPTGDWRLARFFWSKQGYDRDGGVRKPTAAGKNATAMLSQLAAAASSPRPSTSRAPREPIWATRPVSWAGQELSLIHI